MAWGLLWPCLCEDIVAARSRYKPRSSLVHGTRPSLKICSCWGYEGEKMGGVHSCVCQIWKNGGSFSCLSNPGKLGLIPVNFKTGKIGVHSCVCQIWKNGGSFPCLSNPEKLGLIPVFVKSGKVGVHPCVCQIWKNWGSFPCLLNLEKWGFIPVFVKSGKIGAHSHVC